MIIKMVTDLASPSIYTPLQISHQVVESIFPLLELELATWLALADGVLANIMQHRLGKVLVNKHLGTNYLGNKSKLAHWIIRAHMEENQGILANRYTVIRDPDLWINSQTCDPVTSQSSYLSQMHVWAQQQLSWPVQNRITVQITRRLRSQINGCFLKPLGFGVVCYTAQVT